MIDGDDEYCPDSIGAVSGVRNDQATSFDSFLPDEASSGLPVPLEVDIAGGGTDVPNSFLGDSVVA